MWIEDAGILLNDCNGPIVSLNGVERALPITEHGSEVQSEILRVELCCEAVAQAIFLAGRDVEVVARGGQVADDAGTLLVVDGPEAPTDEVDGDRLRLLVGDGEHGLGGVAVDELNAEDFGGGEGGCNGDGEIGALRWIFDIFGGILLSGLSVEVASSRISDSIGRRAYCSLPLRTNRLHAE